MPADRPLAVLTVGLPGVGKTASARRLAAEHRLVRLTPDEWMAPLFELLSLELDERERRTRAARRWRDAPSTTFEMTEADHDRFLSGFTPVTPDELVGHPVPAPPTGCDDWPAWAAGRWPTLSATAPIRRDAPGYGTMGGEQRP